jgi:hypothetical protein
MAFNAPPAPYMMNSHTSLNPPTGVTIGLYTPYAASNPFTEAVQQFIIATVSEPAHRITEVLMPITDLKQLSGAPIVFRNYITISALAADSVPIGSPAPVFGTTQDSFKVRLERKAIAFRVSADALLTAEGMADARMKKQVAEQSVYNTTLITAMRVLMAVQNDVARVLRVHLAEASLRRVEEESSKLGTIMSGILNRRTGGLSELVESFNVMFRFYGKRAKYLLVSPETAALRSVRPEVPGTSWSAINPDHTRQVLSNSPDLEVIECPALPWDTTGELTQVLARPVYASSFVLVKPGSGRPADGTTIIPNNVTGVRVFDGRRNEFPVLDVGRLMRSDPTLVCDHDKFDFTHSPFGVASEGLISTFFARVRAGDFGEKTQDWLAAARVKELPGHPGPSKQRAKNLMYMHPDVILNAMHVIPIGSISARSLQVPAGNVFGPGEVNVFTMAAESNRLLAPIVLVRPAGMATAHTVMGFSDAAGTVYTTTPGQQTAGRPQTSDIFSQLFWFVGGFVHSPHNFCRAPLAVLIPGSAGMGVNLPTKAQLNSGKLGENLQTHDLYGDSFDSTEESTSVDIIPISVLSGVDSMAKLDWFADPTKGRAGSINEHSSSKDRVSKFVSVVLQKLGVNPAMVDQDGVEDGSNPTVMQFCATRYTTNHGAKKVYTIVPESASLMCNGERLSSEEGMHPYGCHLEVSDIFGNSGMVGSAARENIHGVLRTITTSH